MTLRACFPAELRPRASASADAEKRRLRAAIVARRDQIDRQTRRRAAILAAHHLETWLETARDTLKIAAFVDFGSEIDTAPLVAMLQWRGFSVGMPVVRGKGQPLIFRRVRPFQTLQAGAFGIPAPAENAPIIDPDLFLVPFAAFDGAGYRIGYGGGFYDRTLAQARARRGRHVLAIGYGYAAQEIPRAPRDQYDLAMDGVVTEHGLCWFPRAGIGARRWAVTA